MYTLIVSFWIKFIQTCACIDMYVRINAHIYSYSAYYIISYQHVR